MNSVWKFFWPLPTGSVVLVSSSEVNYILDVIMNNFGGKYLLSDSIMRLTDVEMLTARKM